MNGTEMEMLGTFRGNTCPKQGWILGKEHQTRTFLFLWILICSVEKYKGRRNRSSSTKYFISDGNKCFRFSVLPLVLRSFLILSHDTGLNSIKMRNNREEDERYNDMEDS